MIPYLPPLPPLPGENNDLRYRPPGRSIIAVLSEEHLQIAALSAELAGTLRPRDALADVFTATVTRHLSAEEQYLYPVVKALLPDGDLIAQRETEHDTHILQHLALLETVEPTGRTFHDLTKTLDDELRTHQRSCSHDIFPQLREAASEADLIRLGNRVELAEEAAPTRPHPAPIRPPWNKVTDPALGLVDKIRDVASGRTTYTDDL